MCNNSCGNCGHSCAHGKRRTVWNLMAESAIGGFLIALAFLFSTYCNSLNSGISRLSGYVLFGIVIYLIFATGAKIPTVCVLYNMRNKGKDMFKLYRESFKGWDFAGKYGRGFILVTMAIESIIFFALGILFAVASTRFLSIDTASMTDLMNTLNATSYESFINGVFRGFLGGVLLFMSFRIYTLSDKKYLSMIPIILMIALGGTITPIVMTMEIHSIIVGGGTLLLHPILRTLLGNLIAVVIWSALVQD